MTRYWIDATTVSFREVAGEVVVLDLRNSSYVTVNDAGAVLWRLLSQGATPDDLAAALEQRFGLAHDDARRDSSAFLAALDERKYVTTHGPSR